MDWKSALEFLVPAEGEVHARSWYAWAGFGVFCFWLFFWWTLGLAPSAFGAGFARAEDTKFNTQMLLESRLSSVKQQQCLAEDRESRLYWSSELNRLMVLYKEKLGAEYHEPPCTAIVATTSEDR